MNLGQRRRGTGSRSAPCPLGYRERVEGCNPLASSPSGPTTVQDSLTPTTGRGKAPARSGRAGEETLASPPPQSCPVGVKEQAHSLSRWACASLLHCVPVYLEVTVHVSEHASVNVYECDLEGISV